MESRTKYFLILLAAGLLLFLFKIGERDLWEPDETRYAVVAQEMRQSGNWVVPHLNGTLYKEKPPLFFWMINLSALFLGEESALTNRLPSALAGVVTLLLTFHLGGRLFNPTAGFLSGMVLSTCFFFPQISRWVMLDSLFCLLFFLSVYSLYLGMSVPRKQRFHFLVAGVFMAFGTLTKGPIGFLPIALFLVYGAIVKEFRKGWNRNLLYGVLLSVGLVLVWFLPAVWIAGKGYGTPNILIQTVGRFATGKSHPQSFYFYFIRFPAEFFPWIVFLPVAFALGLRKGYRQRREFLFLLTWFIFVFLFFTLSVEKKDNYILPLYPAAAIMVGSQWESWFRSKEGGKGFLSGFLFLTFLFLAAMVLLLLEIQRGSFVPLIAYHSLGVSIVAYLFSGSLLSLLFLSKGMKWASFLSLMIAWGILQLHISYVLPPKLNPQRSVRAFSEEILRRMEPGDELKTCVLLDRGLLYYTKKRYIENITKKERFLEIFNSPQRVFFVMLPETLNKLKKETGLKTDPIEQGKSGGRDYVLISNR